MDPSPYTPGTPPVGRRVLESGWTRILLSKVPEVTLLFWVVKVLSTTVGVTTADYLARDLGLGLPATTAVMGILLAVALITQFSLRRYVPAAYWLAVVLTSVVGTLLSDNLVHLGVGLWASTSLLAVALVITFVAWYRSEHTLSIHTVVTRRREAFYWLAILLTFALGTSVGDLVGQDLAVGYLPSAVIIGGVLAGIVVAHRRGLNAVLAFWAAYVVTRPLGASIGDFLTAKPADGGLGLGTDVTTALFLIAILVIVGWFTVQGRRQPHENPAHRSGYVLN